MVFKSSLVAFSLMAPDLRIYDIYTVSQRAWKCAFLFGPKCLLHLDGELDIDFHRHLSLAVQWKRLVIMCSQLSVRKCDTGLFFFFFS